MDDLRRLITGAGGQGASRTSTTGASNGRRPRTSLTEESDFEAVPVGEADDTLRGF